MEERKFENKKRYILSLLIGTVIFLLVFGITSSISYLEFQRISNQQTALAYKIFQDKLAYSFFNKSICLNESFESISDDLGFQGKIIDDIEKNFGKNDKRVLLRKEFYSLIEVEHLEFLNSKMKDCNFHINTILFFYSNLDKDLSRSNDVGEMLDNIHATNVSNSIIYSFDINLNSTLIQDLMRKYNVQKSPTVIINQKFTVFNPLNIDDIKKYLT